MDIPGSPNDVVVAGNYAYIANGHSGLLVEDISDPRNLVSICIIETPDYAQSVTVSEGYVCVADGLSGVQIIKAITVEK